ncbi:hypothetical protein [Peribacillus alkalitolerans]|uniref:hypothetical protein n=1 Tax=Peribacillus alkalitolerans TaxID=1550385 RepID=UPI0013D59F88|nr:hypothetical protein [Peribacillus alkalitolerans]
MDTEISHNELLKCYQQIWNNRNITDGEDPSGVLHELIKRELLDENSHPRIRKSKYEKFYMSIARLIESTLHENEKSALLQQYLNIMKNL